MTTASPPHWNHLTIAEAGQCPDCRAWIVDFMRDAPSGFLLLFARPGAPDVEAIAAVRDYDPTEPVECAWATGCNAGAGYSVGSIGPGNPDSLPDDVPWFQLITGPDAITVLKRIKSPNGVAAIDAFRASLHGHGDGCSECNLPLNINPN